MPLGLMPGMVYEENEVVLAPGDCLLLHSDGIVEAHDPQREMFGFPRLKETVGAAPGGQAMIDRVLAELERFTGPDAEQEDDITMLTLQRAAVLDEFDAAERGRQRARGDRAGRAAPCAALGDPRRPARTPQDRGRRGDDERDRARQRSSGPTGRCRCACCARATACACRSPTAATRTVPRARDARPRGEARGRAAAARLGTVSDRRSWSTTCT